MNDTLKKCPFCGGEAEFNDFYGKYGVSCENSECNIVCSVESTQEQAIKAWNTRAPEPNEGEIRNILEKYENRIRNTLSIGSEYKVSTLAHQNECIEELSHFTTRAVKWPEEVEHDTSKIKGSPHEYYDYIEGQNDMLAKCKQALAEAGIRVEEE